MYKNRRINNNAISALIRDIGNGKIKIPKNRLHKLGGNEIYVIGGSSVREIPCKYLMELACARTDPSQKRLSPSEHITTDAERYLRNNGFKLSR